MDSILKDCKISLLALKAASDNEAINGSGVDMQGFDSVAFIAGAYRGNVGSPTIKVQQDSDVAFGTAADLLGTSATFTTAAGTDGLTTVEIHNPGKRYLRPVLTIPDWTAVATFCIAIQHNAIDEPQTNAGEIHISPAEGTA